MTAKTTCLFNNIIERLFIMWKYKKQLEIGILANCGLVHSKLKRYHTLQVYNKTTHFSDKQNRKSCY